MKQILLVAKVTALYFILNLVLFIASPIVWIATGSWLLLTYLLFVAWQIVKTMWAQPAPPTATTHLNRN